MAGNPYIAVDRLRARNRRRVEGPVSWARGLVPLGTALALIPVVRSSFLAFLDREPAVWAEGVETLAIRVVLAVIAWLSLEVYAEVIRGRDRGVLEILPVEPAAVVVAALRRVWWRRWWLVPATLVVCAPIAAAGAWALWGLLGVLAAGAFALGMSASAMVHLLAVEAAESPRFEGLLDLVRGNNPRAQAAFIWAPGVVLVSAGIVVIVATGGLSAVADGAAAGWALLALPFVAALVAWLPVPGLARRSWFRASGVLSEIRARYAALEDPREALRVYLEWAVRFLPTRLGRYALLDLRHGWRARRPWISATWLVGLGAGVAGWTADPAGVGRAVAVAAAGAWLCGAVGVVMEDDDPEFLRRWLPAESGQRAIARTLVLVGWLQCCVWPGALAVAGRQGLGSGLRVLAGGEASVAAVALVGVLASRASARGKQIYAPVAVLTAATTAAWWMG